MEQLSQRFGTAHWYEHFAGDFLDALADDPDKGLPTAWSQWCIAREGEIHMHCVSADDVYVYRCEETSPVDSLDELNAWMEANDQRSEPRPAQAEHVRTEAYTTMLVERGGDDRLPPEDQEPDGFEDHSYLLVDPVQDLVFGARAAAQRLSVDLASLGPHTLVQGTGMLAVPHSLRNRLRRGALPI